MTLEGQVAVVTGAAGGIGAASARHLSTAGAAVVMVDVDGERLERAAAELPGPSATLVGDVADEDLAARYVALAIERFGRLDLHHLNAGIGGSFAPLPDLTLADFDRVLDVNLRGMFVGLQAAFRQYRAQQSGGSIVLTASIASHRGSADLIAYQTSKHAVVGLLHGAAMYGGPLGVRVNAVAPGIVPTELFAANSGSTGGQNDMVQRAATTPLRRAGTPDDIASVVCFLLGPGAAYMTGALVPVDGGAAIVSTVRPSGGAGRWDTDAVDRAMYGEFTTATGETTDE